MILRFLLLVFVLNSVLPSTAVSHICGQSNPNTETQTPHQNHASSEHHHINHSMHDHQHHASQPCDCCEDNALFCAMDECSCQIQLSSALPELFFAHLTSTLGNTLPQPPFIHYYRLSLPLDSPPPLHLS